MSVIDNISNGSLMCVQGEIREYHSLYAEKLIILEEKWLQLLTLKTKNIY